MSVKSKDNISSLGSSIKNLIEEAEKVGKDEKNIRKGKIKKPERKKTNRKEKDRLGLNIKDQSLSIDGDSSLKDMQNRLGIKSIKRIGDINRREKLKEENSIDREEVRSILYNTICDLTRNLLKDWVNNKMPVYAKEALADDIKDLLKFQKFN